MNIYLIVGDSYHLINKEIKKIVRDNIYISMNLNQVTIEDVIKEASYYSLIDNKKYIIARNATCFENGKLTDSESNMLINYLNNPNPQTTIIFTSNNIDARKKISKIIKEKYKIINIPVLDYLKTTDIINKYCAENGKKIESAALKYLMENTKSIDCIFQELDKLFLFYGDLPLIKYEDTKNIVGSIVDDNSFHFITCVLNRNLEGALKILQDLKLYKVEIITLIILLAREYRNMYYLKKYFEAHLNIHEIGEKLKMQDWQVKKLYQNSLNYQEKELLANIKKLAAIDIGIKTGTMEKDIALLSFLVDVCN